MSSALDATSFQNGLGGTTAAVWGLGKMGLPLSTVLAEAGATVWGVDIDADIVEAVNAGRCPVDGEPGLADRVAEYGGDRLRATTDGTQAARDAEVMIVLVPTVLDDANDPDLSPVIAAGEAISSGVSTGDLVILESTVPPGTTAGVFRDAVEPADLTAGPDFGLAHCPERTSSGRAIRDLTESYPKIVGGIDSASTSVAASLYRTFNEPGVVEMDGTTVAEAVKVFEGVYRDVNIALANELAMACEEWGIDAETVFEAANSQPFCDIHTPGIGVGGHCIPVYPHFVMNQAEHTSLLSTARSINDGMPAHAVAIVERVLNRSGTALDESRVLVLGLTYRPGVRELRYAPAIATIESLNEAVGTVFAHDPLLDDATIDEVGATPVPDPSTVENLDGLVLATGHDEYRSLDLDELRERMRTPLLMDGRWFFDRDDTEGFIHIRIGDGTTDHPRSQGGSSQDQV